MDRPQLVWNVPHLSTINNGRYGVLDREADGALGEQYLRDFQDNEKTIPPCPPSANLAPGSRSFRFLRSPSPKPGFVLRAVASTILKHTWPRLAALDLAVLHR